MTRDLEDLLGARYKETTWPALPREIMLAKIKTGRDVRAYEDTNGDTSMRGRSVSPQTKRKESPTDHILPMRPRVAYRQNYTSPGLNKCQTRKQPNLTSFHIAAMDGPSGNRLWVELFFRRYRHCGILDSGANRSFCPSSSWI